MYQFTTNCSVIYPLISQLLLIYVATIPQLLEEAVARRRSANKVFLKILQNSQENNMCQSLFK